MDSIPYRSVDESSATSYPAIRARPAAAGELSVTGMSYLATSRIDVDHL
ncbi:hypothetical protein ACFWTE_19455 [Nocardiopsis sp. NPDC058631]